MVETKFIRIAHGEDAHFVALYKGIDPQEGSSLLRAAFRVPQHVVGFISEGAQSGRSGGVVVPLSLACKAPEILEGQTYTLLLSDTEADRDRARASSVSRWSRRSHADLPETAIAEKLEVGDFPLTAGGDVGEGTGVAESRQPAATADPSASGEDDEENIDTMSKIMAIIHRMSDYGMLSYEERCALESLTVAGDVVVNAAFNVGLESRDMDYMAALFTDLAALRLDNSQGERLLCDKREMLDVAQALHGAHEINKEQWLYLQNVILAGHEALNEPLSTYQLGKDRVRLADELKHLCGGAGGLDSHGRPVASLIHPHQQQPQQKLVSRSASRVSGPSPPTIASAAWAADVNEAQGIASSDGMGMKELVLQAGIHLADRGFIGALEASLLNEMVVDDRPVLVAICKKFVKDGNEVQLHDAVLRAARLEVKQHLCRTPMVSSHGSSPATAAGSQSTKDGNGQSFHAPRPAAAAAANVSQGQSASERAPFLAARSSTRVRGVPGGAAGREVIGVQGTVGFRARGGGVGGGDGSGGSRRGGSGGGLSAGVGSEKIGGADGGGGILPAEFLRLVEVAVRRRVVDVEDGRILCAAFHSGVTGSGGRLEDLVHGAWRVYETTGDEEDAVDSLVRIVRLAIAPFKPDARPSVEQSRIAAGSTQMVVMSSADLRGEVAAAMLAIAAESATILLDKKRVTPEEASCLAFPSENGCAAVLRELALFERDKSKPRLLDAMEKLAKQEMSERSTEGRDSGPKEGRSSGSGIGGGDDNDDADNDNDDNDNDDNGNGDDDNADDCEEHANHDKSNDNGEDRNNEDDDDDEDDGDGGDDDDDDVTEFDGNGSPDHRAIQELLELVECISGDRRVSHEETLKLRELIYGQDPGLLRAHSDYVKDQDVNLLVGALERTAREYTVTTQAEPAAELVPFRPTQEAAAAAGGETNAQGRQQPLLREKAVLMLMHETHVLDTAETAHVQRLLAQEDPEVTAAFRSFDSTKNVPALVHALKTILNTQNAGGHHVAESVVSIVDGMGLSEGEAAALRLAIANNDANIRGAIELYRVDSDAQELQDTLARVARQVLQREVALRQEASDIDVAGAGLSAPAASTAPSSSASSSPSSSSNVRQSTAPTHVADLAHGHRAEVFQALVQQLTMMDVIDDEQGKAIVERYREKDAVVLAALDVYQHEKDLAELVDTLRRLT